MAKSAKSEAKKALKRLHTTTKILIVVALLLGIGAGALTCHLMSRGDAFELQGNKSYQIELNTTEGAAPFLYEEEGVLAVAFGQDVAGKVSVQTSLQKDDAGRYMIPVDKEGVYTITYTVESLKYNGTLGEQIRRVRTFFVSAVEEDGRDE